MITGNLWEHQLADAALAEYGFANSKYGDVPYHYVWQQLTNLDTDVAARLDVVADNRVMGVVTIHVDGEATVKLDLANWINPQYYSFVVYENIGFAVHNSTGCKKVIFDHGDGPRIKQVGERR